LMGGGRERLPAASHRNKALEPKTNLEKKKMFLSTGVLKGESMKGKTDSVSTRSLGEKG